MRIAALVSLLLGLSASAVVGGVSSPPTHFMDGPPARVTGGFGEDSCQDCHWDFDVGDPGGSLRVEGIPEAFVPGERYPITVLLSRPQMESGGFQLAARFASDTTQAGSFDVAERDRARVRVNTDRDVEFVQHTLVGVPVERPHVTAWTVIWTAPGGSGVGGGPQAADSTAGGPPPPVVLFHASAVAGDGDESQVGDFVYVFEGRSVRADP